MIDLSSPNSGAQIVMASSNDSRFPATNILDGKSDTFWTTTGLYPQSFVLALSEAADVKTIIIHSYNIKDLRIEKTIKEDPVEFEDVLETGLESTEGTPQQKSFSPALCEARYLKFIIKSGYDHFCAVYKLSVSGVCEAHFRDDTIKEISHYDKNTGKLNCSTGSPMIERRCPSCFVFCIKNSNMTSDKL